MLQTTGRISDGVKLLPVGASHDRGSLYFAAIACEVLARRIVHQSPKDSVPTLLSSRFKHRQSDGDIEVSSALELAIDSHW